MIDIHSLANNVLACLKTSAGFIYLSVVNWDSHMESQWNQVLLYWPTICLPLWLSQCCIASRMLSLCFSKNHANAQAHLPCVEPISNPNSCIKPFVFVWHMQHTYCRYIQVHNLYAAIMKIFLKPPFFSRHVTHHLTELHTGSRADAGGRPCCQSHQPWKWCWGTGHHGEVRVTLTVD